VSLPIFENTKSGDVVAPARRSLAGVPIALTITPIS